jgi:DNA-binding GntR family transcriptional regulator
MSTHYAPICEAAERASAIAEREGPAYIARGRAAVKSRSIARMISADMDFHFFLYGLSGNPLVAEVSNPHWSYLRRVMGEVLLFGETPRDIWDQHEAILSAVASEDAAKAERVAREHISLAAETLSTRIADREQANGPPALGMARQQSIKLTRRRRKGWMR